MTQTVLGLDIGTSGAKALVVDPYGRVVARGSARLPAPDVDGLCREQNAGLWWTAASAAIDDALTRLRAAGGWPDTIAAISVDATSGTVVPVDAAMTPVRNGMMYNDGRAAAQAAQLNIAGKQTLSRLGYRYNTSFAAAKILWLRQNEPETARQTAWYLHQSDVITTRLMETDRPVSDESNALKTGFDILERQWPSYLSDAGIDIVSLPEVKPIGATLGRIGPSIASRYGLSPRCRIVAGMSDGTAAAAASGARIVGDMNTTLGTTIVWKMISGAIVRDPQGRLYSHRHPGGSFMPGGAGNAGGDGIRTMVEAAQDGAGERLDDLAAAIDGRAPSSCLTYPAPAPGERFPFVEPAFEPFTTCPSNDATERYLSALEGAGFVERWGYDVARGLGADCFGTVWTTGSGAMIDPWMQIRADILGQPVSRAAVPASGFGSAVVAAMNAWHDGDWNRVADTMIREVRRFEPDPDRHAHYTDRYRKFRDACARRFGIQSGQHSS